MIRGIETDNISEIANWCAELNNYGPHEVSWQKRAEIAVYQSSQAMQAACSNEHNMYNESLAAAFLHSIMLQKVFEGTPQILEYNKLSKIRQSTFDTGAALLHGGQLIRMVVYSTSTTSRSYKFDPNVVCFHAHRYCLECISAVPRENRVEAIYNASETMATLGKSKK